MTALQRLLPSLNRADATAPRVTFYDDATGERIELSAKVLSNWAAKAANALVEEFDAALGTTVGLVLPLHWRAFYWALACLLYTSPSPRDRTRSRMPSSA